MNQDDEHRARQLLTSNRAERSGRNLRLQVKLLPRELARARLADFGPTTLISEGPARVTVVASHRVLTTLLRAERFSNRWEDGGFLIGHAYAGHGAEDRYIVALEAAPLASATRASALSLTYTSDSFAAIKQALRAEYPGQQLLGWYHTHLFPAAEAMGLSETDLGLHFSTFREPWQVAGLLNLVPGYPSVVRFYAAAPPTMALCSLYCRLE